MICVAGFLARAPRVRSSSDAALELGSRSSAETPASTTACCVPVVSRSRRAPSGARSPASTNSTLATMAGYLRGARQPQLPRVVHRLGCSAHEVERGEDGRHHLERISPAHLARSPHGSATDCWTGDYPADRGVYGWRAAHLRSWP